ncbi:GNAT family N-acetyltransferase [uncultured Clostridium sp.]|uniref:GNAT family N-acetyltransferase n=1 Tax=uncultured Clostridium sp. TaxID=59620 RepID=UPI0028E3AE30|nr:GNAT family N-acetyltransferase [uncultured Clostridium sp.]
MLDIEFDLQDINILNIQKEDEEIIQHWLYEQCEFYEGDIYPIEIDKLHDRFLEYYISENEFFVKIQHDGKLIGIIKGRIEFKNPTEAWVWCIMLDYRYRNLGIGSNIINELNKYLIREYGVANLYTTIVENPKTINFLKKNGYKIIRSSKNYYDINGKQMDMLILKK